MFYLVSNKKKIIFGFNNKCGSSKIIRIFKYLEYGQINPSIHLIEDYQYKLPTNIEDYIIIIFSRNPYKRLISGFLDKYRKNGLLRYLWKYNILTFSKFVDKLIKNKWDFIEPNHFTLQTEINFDKEYILKANKFICYDIENIDYKYIEKLFNKKIIKYIINKKEGHERNKFNKDFNKNVYDLNINFYYNFNVKTKYFYNKEIKQKVYSFFENDFLFFKSQGIDYN